MTPPFVGAMSAHDLEHARDYCARWAHLAPLAHVALCRGPTYSRARMWKFPSAFLPTPWLIPAATVAAVLAGCGNSPRQAQPLTCEAGLLACDGGCVDPSTDRANCGSCGTPCHGWQAECVEGRCDCLLRPTYAYCGYECIDAMTESVCGACDVRCQSGEYCLEGACIVPQGCPPGHTACTTGCADLQRDSAHCGICGGQCYGNQICEGGSCVTVTTCPPGYTDCGGRCVWPATDRAHCGSCDHACLNYEYCSDGLCREVLIENDAACGYYPGTEWCSFGEMTVCYAGRAARVQCRDACAARGWSFVECRRSPGDDVCVCAY